MEVFFPAFKSRTEEAILYLNREQKEGCRTAAVQRQVLALLVKSGSDILIVDLAATCSFCS